MGCTHGCCYCYGPVTVHRTKEEFYGGMVPKKDIETKLTSDCRKLQEAGYNGRILLSHVTDPYQPAETVLKLTRRAIKILNEYGINFQVLTKGGTRACRDFDLYKPGDSFAISLTTLDKEKAAKVEPGAAAPPDRINALRLANEAGIDTWISLEPVI